MNNVRKLALDALKGMVEIAQMSFGIVDIPEGADGPLPKALEAIAALEKEAEAVQVEPVALPDEWPVAFIE